MTAGVKRIIPCRPGLCLISADIGIGKTSLLCGIAAALTTSGHCDGFLAQWPIPPGPGWRRQTHYKRSTLGTPSSLGLWRFAKGSTT
jgi:hypothetical protein